MSGAFFFIVLNVTIVMLCIQLYKHHGRENKSFMAYLLYGLNTLVIIAGFVQLCFVFSARLSNVGRICSGEYITDDEKNNKVF